VSARPAFLKRLQKRLRTRRSRIRALRNDLDILDARFRPRINDAKTQIEAENLRQECASEGSLLYEDIDSLETEILISKARFWRVSPPLVDYLRLEDNNDPNWERTRAFGYMILKPAARNQMIQQLWNRKVEIAVIIFGISSVMQTVYTVMAYYRSSP
jgi:hypothetical protein